MSRHSDALSRARISIDDVLTTVATGTADRPLSPMRLDLALVHADAWAADQPPAAALGETGGSSAAVDTEERKEKEQTKRRAASAATRIPEICRSVVRQMRLLEIEVNWLIETIDEDDRPAALPGCRSCARRGGKDDQLGGHFAAVYEKAKSSGLCRWCYDHQLATGELPPVKACDIYHREGPRAAGLHLAKAKVKQPV